METEISGALERKKFYPEKELVFYKSDELCYIYVLWTESEGIRYVGKSVNIYYRFKRHLIECKEMKTHKDRWIMKNILNCVEIFVSPVDVCYRKDEFDFERFWVKYYRELGCYLTNSTDGGEGFPSGERHPNFGKHLSDDMKEKISLGEIGKVVSDETKNKLSEVTKKLWENQEYRDRVIKTRKSLHIIPWNKGKKESDGMRVWREENKEKISLTMKRLWKDEEYRKKMRKSRKEAQSKEHIIKRKSDVMKERWKKNKEEICESIKLGWSKSPHKKENKGKENKKTNLDE